MVQRVDESFSGHVYGAWENSGDPYPGEACVKLTIPSPHLIFLENGGSMFLLQLIPTSIA